MQNYIRQCIVLSISLLCICSLNGMNNASAQKIQEIYLNGLNAYEKNIQTFEEWTTQNCNQLQRDEIAPLLQNAHTHITEFRQCIPHEQASDINRFSQELITIKNQLIQWQKGIQQANATAAAIPEETHTAAPEEAVPEEQNTCIICQENKSVHDFIQLNCNHLFCKTCLHALLLAARDQSIPLCCPTCKENLLPQDMQVIMDAFLNALDERVQQKWLAAQPNVIHCPTPNCKHAFINESACMQQITCPQCNKSYCSGCLQEHNPTNISCADYGKQLTINAAEHATHEWKLQNTKQCPNCHTEIEKNGGCNHMQCKSCHYQFCWRCLGKYDKRCLNGCRLYEFTPYNGQPANVHQQPVPQPTMQTNWSRKLSHTFQQFVSGFNKPIISENALTSMFQACADNPQTYEALTTLINNNYNKHFHITINNALQRTGKPFSVTQDGRIVALQN